MRTGRAIGTGRHGMSATAREQGWNANLALDASIAALAVRRGVGVVVPWVLYDALLHYRGTDLVVSEGADRSLLVVAVARRGRPIGALAVADRAGRGFDDRDVATAERFAEAAASAMAPRKARERGPALLHEVLGALEAETAALYTLAESDQRLTLVAALDRAAR